MKNVLLGPNKLFAKRYSRALVTEIRVTGNVVTIIGSSATLAAAVAGGELLNANVSRFGLGWLPEQGSNLSRDLVPPLSSVQLETSPRIA